MSSFPLPLKTVQPSVESEPARFSVEVGGQMTAITSLPATVNLNLYRGDDFVLALTVSDSEGEPVDLSGAVARAQIRPTADGELAGAFDAVIDGNVVELHLTSAISARLPLRAVWDCLIDESGFITTLAAGAITLVADVTRQA